MSGPTTPRRGTLAVVPARGGSRGVPGKNLRPLGGRPLLAYAVAAAQGAAGVDRVVVSTDDPAIAVAARALGAGVVERPAELAGDAASSESALLHALETLEREEGYRPATLVFLQCTAPLVEAADVDGTLAALAAAGADCAFAAVPFAHFLWAREADGGATPIGHPLDRRPRRQEVEDRDLEAGSVYAMRAEGFLRHRHRFFGRVVAHRLAASHWVEIDQPVDLEVAEVLLAQRRRQAALDLLPRPPAALVFDFDGVMTDNRVLVLEDGREGVLCDRGDGMGIELLRDLPLAVAVLSRERNPVVAARCRKLEIECVQGLRDKEAALVAWLAGRGVDAAATVFVGNDVNDLGCMRRVGCPVAVADAVPEVRRAARLVLAHPGGRGAVREIAELVTTRMGRQPWQEP